MTKKYEKLSKKKLGFTLAEVLITLGIIGVVSAITIPTLVKNYQKMVTEVQFKKVFSEIVNAVKLAEIEHGSMNTWRFGNAAEDDLLSSSKYFFENYLKLKIDKACYPVSEECWATTYSLDGIPAYSSKMYQGSGYSAVITKSGYAIFSQIGRGVHNIVFDINGKRPPNILGKDAFVMDFNTDSSYIGISFRKGKDQTNEERIVERDKYCSKGCSSKAGTGRYCGYSCGAVIFDNNWKIPENYPW